MNNVEGGKGIHFFQAQNAIPLKQIQADAEEMRQLRSYIEFLQRKLLLLEKACQSPLQNLQTVAVRRSGLQCCA